jgi:molybdopterin/thiamine biosynthesis adenylyltransferase
MAHVIVIGAGTIGSHVLPHVARMAGVRRVTIVDRDRYDQSNLRAQGILRTDVGKSKAQAQARRLRQIDATLDVRAFHKPVEDLPLGWLRGDVILACLDSRRARMVVNQAAWRIGVPWINAGVDATESLARVQVFLPAEDASCLECAWDARDYELVEQDYPCQDAAAPPDTGASSALGAVAAALQALECEKLLSGDRLHLLAGRDVLLDIKHHRHYVTRFTRNPACRMPDHAGWSIAPYDGDPASTTLADLIALTSTLRGAARSVRVGVAGQRFAMSLTCVRCRQRLPVARVHRGEGRGGGQPCRACGGALAASGFDMFDQVALEELPEYARSRSLTELGLLPGDILVCSTPEVEAHIELGAGAWPIAS